jgi:2-methylcitrate dehydratase PrpD
MTAMDATDLTATTLSRRLANYVLEERLERIDPAAVARTKQIIAYHVGLAFQSLRNDDPDARQALAIARMLSGDCGDSTIIGRRERTTVAEAAFVNCTLMRAMGLDDVIFPAGVHPALVSVPVALALAERHRRPGAELITAIVVAYELLGKFGRWSWSLETPRRSVMLFGAFGAIATAGRLLQLDAGRMTHAIGYAAHTTMGLAEGNTGPATHYYGLVCRNGIAGAGRPG